MRVIVAGSRSIIDPAVVNRAIMESGFNMSEVVCGCAPGVDALGARWATSRCIPVTYFPADWTGLGRAAGPARNREMAAYADALVAVWDGLSRGTADMIREAKTRGLLVHVRVTRCPLLRRGR